MRHLIKYALCTVLSLLFTAEMRSQDLPSLPKASEITVGKFPNGAPYYIVKSQSSKGYADFALVRKGDSACEDFRQALVSLPHFNDRKPYQFLADNGVGYASDGYISVREDATVLRFADVPIYKKEVQDSTLLLLFDAMALSKSPQAIVISGDVDIAKIRERAELFSMMVPPIRADKPGENDAWTPRDSLRSVILTNNSHNVAAVDIIYSAPRIGRKNLPTVLPLVTRKYSAELGEILSSRIRSAFRSQDIPLADVRYRYKDSSVDSQDERYTLSVFVPADSLDSSLALLGRTLGTFDKTGATLSEFLRARELASAPSAPVPDSRKNAAGIDRCISAYLYGSSLASAETTDSFMAGRALEDARELELFNAFACALTDSTANLVIRCQVPALYFYRGVTVDSFLTGWSNSNAEAPADAPELTLSTSPSRTKLRTEGKESISGGTLLTFVNGVKVAVKQTQTKGRIHFELMLNGGSAGISSLQRGESAFASDMLDICDIDGMSAVEFRQALLKKGITLDTKVTPTNILLSGDAPSSEVQSVIGALQAFASKRSVNRSEYEYFRRCEKLREDMLALSPRNIMALMDSTLCPNYLYPEVKNVRVLGDDFPERAEQLFARQFSKVDDGLLILIGDADVEALKRELPKLLGDFSVQKSYSPRPSADFRMIAGKTATITSAATGIVGGAEIGSNIGVSALMPFNLASWMSFRVACDVLRMRLVSAMTPLGAYVTVTGEEETFPVERLKVYISCRPCQESGVPADIAVADQLDVMTELRRVLNDMALIKVGKEDLKAYKTRLSSHLEADLKDPRTMASMMVVRYSESKDLVTTARSAVDAVSAESVSKILAALASGSQVEYIIQ